MVLQALPCTVSYNNVFKWGGCINQDSTVLHVLAVQVFFALDIVIRVCILRIDFFKVWMNYIDAAVSAASVAEVAIAYTDLPVNLAIFRAPQLATGRK